jgi:hypothetical protein
VLLEDSRLAVIKRLPAEVPSTVLAEGVYHCCSPLPQPQLLSGAAQPSPVVLNHLVESGAEPAVPENSSDHSKLKVPETLGEPDGFGVAVVVGVIVGVAVDVGVELVFGAAAPAKFTIP